MNEVLVTNQKEFKEAFQDRVDKIIVEGRFAKELYALRALQTAERAVTHELLKEQDELEHGSPATFSRMSKVSGLSIEALKLLVYIDLGVVIRFYHTYYFAEQPKTGEPFHIEFLRNGVEEMLKEAEKKKETKEKKGKLWRR